MNYSYQLLIILLLLGSTLSGCNQSDEPEIESKYEIINDYTYLQLINLIGEERLSLAVESLDAEGALGRNQGGYFHVRFQLGMTSLSDYAVVTERTDVIGEYLQTLEYAFAHQLESGDFDIVVPQELQNNPSYVAPTEEDLLSGVAFFGSSLGLSLVTLNSSTWFMQTAENEAYRSELATYLPQITALLNHLMSKKETLSTYDAEAPNRLLFDALAFYSLGVYLNHQSAKQTGQDFMNQALNRIDQSEGYFIEGGGWDSSYNGVAIKLAMELLSIMDGEQTLALESAIISATKWQISRIGDDGEISSEGNTRVFPGGELFIGEEKNIDYAKTVKALLYFGLLTASDGVVNMADQVLHHYLTN